MTNGFNPAATAGTVMGIAGMGIGLGLLAGMSRGIMDTMYGPPRQQRRRGYAPKRYSRPRTSYKKPKLTYKPRSSYSYRPRPIKMGSVRPVYKWKF